VPCCAERFEDRDDAGFAAEVERTAADTPTPPTARPGQSDQDQECGYPTKRAITGAPAGVAPTQARVLKSVSAWVSGVAVAIGQIEAIIGFHRVPVRRPDGKIVEHEAVG
jgi:hypothetical protein